MSKELYVSNEESYNQLFSEVKNELLKLDPVAFTEHYLKLKGKPFKLTHSGWKHMADIYRYIALKAIEKSGKPVVIVKGRQVGATVMAAALDLYFTASGLFGYNNAPVTVLHCFPNLASVQRFSQSQLNELIDTSVNDYINQQKLGYNEKTKKVSIAKTPDNMTLKQFRGNNKLWIESLGADSDRIRGISTDFILMDEVQDMTATAIGVALKTSIQSKYGNNGVHVYFGTPKAKGSYFEVSLWNESDKRYYFLCCTNQECGHYFMLSTPGTNGWEKIWLYDQIIQCPKCLHEEDKRVLIENGKWIATEPLNKDGTEKQFVGYHISLLYSPTIDKKYILNQRPENNRSSSERIYYNEVIGEFYSGNDMPITADEIYEKCRDPERSFATRILPGERKTWMGVDWGGKVDSNNSGAGQSYSCVVVLSANNSGILNVEFAYKMKSTDFQYKMSIVKEMYKKFNLQLVAADLGYGQAEVGELQKIYGNRFLGCVSSGMIKKPVMYDPDLLQIKWNKDHYIEEIFDLMRKGKIRLPWRSFEKIDWLVEHITSMEVEHTNVGGIPKKVYKKGPTQNDGLMALIHAYLAYKYDLTKGFSNDPGGKNNSSLPIPKLAYMPKVR